MISGRTLSDVREWVAFEGIHYAGNHGLEIATPENRFVHPAAADSRETIHSLCSRLRDELADVDGVVVEEKGLTATVHYRMVASDEVDRVTSTVRDAVHDQEGISIADGRQILELRPAVDWDKGRAVEWLTGRVVGDDAVRIYLGDDVTDVAAFRALGTDDLAVQVGSEIETPAADCRIPNPTAVAEFLHSIAARRLARSKPQF